MFKEHVEDLKKKLPNLEISAGNDPVLDLIMRIENLKDFQLFIEFLETNGDYFSIDTDERGVEYFLFLLSNNIKSLEAGEFSNLPEMTTDLCKVAWSVYFALCSE